MSWDAAAQLAASSSAVLAPVYDETYQEAIEQLMAANSANSAWIGGRGRFGDDNANTWAWITRKTQTFSCVHFTIKPFVSGHRGGLP